MSVISCLPMMAANGPKKYAVVATDYDAAPFSSTIDGVLVKRGLTEYETGNWWASSRSYNVYTFKGDGSVHAIRTFDVYGGAADAMAAYLNSIPAGRLVVVATHDEPMLNRLTASLLNAMRRCGAGPVYSSGSWVSRSAYVLFGKAGIGADAGLEYYHGTMLSFTFSTVDQEYFNILQR